MGLSVSSKKRVKSCLAAKRWRPQRRQREATRPPWQDLNDKAARPLRPISPRKPGRRAQVAFDGASGKVVVRARPPRRKPRKSHPVLRQRGECEDVDNLMAVSALARSPVPRRGARRHPVGHCQEVLRRRQQVPRDFRGEQTHAEPPRQDLTLARSCAFHPGAVIGIFKQTSCQR